MATRKEKEKRKQFIWSGNNFLRAVVLNLNWLETFCRKRKIGKCWEEKSEIFTIWTFTRNSKRRSVSIRSVGKVLRGAGQNRIQNDSIYPIYQLKKFFLRIFKVRKLYKLVRGKEKKKQKKKQA